MLQFPSDLRFTQEPRSAVLVAGTLGADAFQSDLPIQLLVVGDVDFTQSAAGVKALWAIARLG
jgi:hypothetical protein